MSFSVNNGITLFPPTSACHKLLHFTKLHCTVMHCIALSCTIQCIALYCTALHYIALYCNVFKCIALNCCTVIHCTVLHCTVLYWTLLHCTTLCSTVTFPALVAARQPEEMEPTVYCSEYITSHCTLLYPLLETRISDLLLRPFLLVRLHPPLPLVVF